MQGMSKKESYPGRNERRGRKEREGKAGSGGGGSPEGRGRKENTGARRDFPRQAVGLLEVGGKTCSNGQEEIPEKSQQRVGVSHSLTHTMWEFALRQRCCCCSGQWVNNVPSSMAASELPSYCWQVVLSLLEQQHTIERR